MTEQMQNDLFLFLFFVAPFIGACVMIALYLFWDDYLKRH